MYILLASSVRSVLDPCARRASSPNRIFPLTFVFSWVGHPPAAAASDRSLLLFPRPWIDLHSREKNHFPPHFSGKQKVQKNASPKNVFLLCFTNCLLSHIVVFRYCSTFGGKIEINCEKIVWNSQEISFFLWRNTSISSRWHFSFKRPVFSRWKSTLLIRFRRTKDIYYIHSSVGKDSRLNFKLCCALFFWSWKRKNSFHQVAFKRRHRPFLNV